MACIFDPATAQLSILRQFLRSTLLSLHGPIETRIARDIVCFTLRFLHLSLRRSPSTRSMAIPALLTGPQPCAITLRRRVWIRSTAALAE
jgi:hypothetical protein